MNSKMIDKDERTIFIENASYKYGYNFISFALLLDVMYRSLRFNEAPWELLGIIIISGFIITIYQYQQKILGKTWMKTALFTFVSAIIFTCIFSFFIK